MLTFNASIFVLGIFGGALPEILRIIRDRRKKTFPSYYKSLKFWLGFIFLLALGGLAAWLFEAQNAKAAIACGYAAPELFSRIAASYEEPDRSGDEEFDLRQWWAI